MSPPLPAATVSELVAQARHARAAGDLQGAFGAFQAALGATPVDLRDDPHLELLFETAGLLREMGMPGEALILFDTLAQALPDAQAVLHNRANCLLDLDRAPEALTAFAAQLARWPESVASWIGLAGAAFASGRPKLGRAGFARALALQPDHWGAHLNLGEALATEGLDLEAVDALRRAARLAPDNPAIRFNLANSLVALGDFAEGWAAYEARLDPALDRVIRRAVSCPRWAGEPLNGRHLFIEGEQGLGDQIWFQAFVRHVVEHAGGRVSVEVAAKLVELVQASLPGVEVRALEVERRVDGWHAIGASRPGPADADLFIEMGSLPGLLWDRMGALPSPSSPLSPPPRPALTPDPGRVARWRERLDALGPGPRIGICWRSPLAGRGRGQDYLAIEAWRPILTRLAGRSPPVRLISLQHGDIAGDREWIRRALGLEVEVLPDLDLWDGVHDTAAVMVSLERVVSALTWIAQLGGALGVPTLVVGNSRWVAPSQGRDPIHPSLEPVYPGPHRPWPAGVLAEVAARLAPLA